MPNTKSKLFCMDAELIMSYELLGIKNGLCARVLISRWFYLHFLPLNDSTIPMDVNHLLCMLR